MASKSSRLMSKRSWLALERSTLSKNAVKVKSSGFIIGTTRLWGFAVLVNPSANYNLQLKGTLL